MTIDDSRCSVANCRKPATHRVSAPWSDGISDDFRVYGHSCPDHSGAVIAAAQLRLLRSSLLPGESIGEVVASRLDASLALLHAC